MSRSGMTPEVMNARLASTPYGVWLGARILMRDQETLKLEVPWRDEFAGTPGTQIVHGGVIAAVVDTAGSYAIGAVLGKPLPTIDLRVDYHRSIENETMQVEARVIKLGRSLATAEVNIYDASGRLAASGRGLYAVTSKTDE